MKKKDMNTLDETEVLSLAKEGETAAVEFMLNKYKNFVKSKARTYFLIGAEKSDIIQEGMIGLYKAIKDYNPQSGASFRSFADLCITRQIITAIKTATRQKHMPLNSYISLNKNADDENENTMIDSISENRHLDPEEIMINKERMSFIESKLTSSLSAYETKVLRGYISGKNYSEISIELGKSEKSIDNALQRIKKKIEKLTEFSSEDYI